ncbi:MAG: LOG family protein [Candidatus Gracilibacteria bacterium]|nr:LOG family protein [Candidatus Gracilibacteria bacterium]
MKKLQIGVMGSAADLGYASDIDAMAFEIGKLIASLGCVMVYGAEKDSDSLSTSAARGAKSVGGLVMGVTYGKTPDVWGEMKDLTDCMVCTGMERGGGREFVLVSSCDAIIAIGGGSGTLNEITVAYQKKIPIFVMKGTGGWADKLADQYLDDRYKTDPKRCICKGINNTEELNEALKNII